VKPKRKGPSPTKRLTKHDYEAIAKLQFWPGEVERRLNDLASENAKHIKWATEMQRQLTALESPPPPVAERPVQGPVVGLVVEWDSLTREAVESVGDLGSVRFPSGAVVFGNSWHRTANGEPRCGRIVALPPPTVGMRVWFDGDTHLVESVNSRYAQMVNERTGGRLGICREDTWTPANVVILAPPPAPATVPPWKVGDEVERTVSSLSDGVPSGTRGHVSRVSDGDGDPWVRWRFRGVLCAALRYVARSPCLMRVPATPPKPAEPPSDEPDCTLCDHLGGPGAPGDCKDGVKRESTECAKVRGAVTGEPVMLGDAWIEQWKRNPQWGCNRWELLERAMWLIDRAPAYASTLVWVNRRDALRIDIEKARAGR
jgi:hypothetical protein